MGSVSQSDSNTPETLYHYTSIDAALKIIESRKLWATNVRYLNDITEFEFGLDMVQRRLPDVHPELSFVGLQNFVGREVRDFNAPEFLGLPFVTSFARQDDSLTHWRSYCSQGNGVSIGFRTSSLLEASANRVSLPGTVIPTPSFGEVFYLDGGDHETVDSLINFAYSEAEAESKEFDVSFPETFALHVVSRAAFIKDKSFENEHEYRLVVDGIFWRRDLLRFRPNRSTLVPYVELNIPRSASAPRRIGEPEQAWNAIESITVGPTPNMGLSGDALMTFCWTHDIFPTFKKSRVPYREW